MAIAPCAWAVFAHGFACARDTKAAAPIPQARNGQTQQRRAHALRRLLLVRHAPDDTVVEVDDARRVFQVPLHPKSFVPRQRPGVRVPACCAIG